MKLDLQVVDLEERGGAGWVGKSGGRGICGQDCCMKEEFSMKKLKTQLTKKAKQTTSTIKNKHQQRSKLKSKVQYCEVVWSKQHGTFLVFLTLKKLFINNINM